MLRTFPGRTLLLALVVLAFVAGWYAGLTRREAARAVHQAAPIVAPAPPAAPPADASTEDRAIAAAVAEVRAFAGRHPLPR